MHKKHSSARLAFSLAIALATAAIDREASAQADLFLSAGAWVPVLPEYKAGTISDGGSSTDLFSDDQTDVGAQLTLGGFYHFAPTRTLFESDLQIAGIGSMGSSGTFTDNDPTASYGFVTLDGRGRMATVGGESLTMDVDSDVFHLHKYVGLRDRFSLDWIGLGDITIGCGFSWMLFDQDFQTDARFGDGRRGQSIEDLDTNYLGGEFRGTLRQSIFGQICYFDARYGIYEMDAEYFGTSTLHFNGGGLAAQGDLSTGLKQTTTTAELAMRTDICIGGWLVRPMIGVKYFDDMAQINHPLEFLGGPTTLTTDSAYVFNGSIEFCF
ncbi:hypothetical protein Poly24_37140 [Rosistilla carotiformis]|uniref:Outer membrane protein beta-barrel domain-containing protein n=1 Tax=Rosistilla carotiformis TaxID=2528017 RepID=A0A518JWT2_9BACT|nr:hypothetical protein [Rosistilla carotiformis]QDV69995.1 hypothetical protein Poly24_37140 [Rosistilla carotiformis]